eukprot:gene1364-biopygen665
MPTVLFVYALGLCIMCGRQISRWHIGESSVAPFHLLAILIRVVISVLPGYGLLGFELYLVVVAVYSMAFIVLTFSFAELVSIVPFSGGCYGYSRCAMGPMMGYVAGMFEAAKYIFYATFSLFRLGSVFLYVYGFEEKYQILIWLGFLIVFNVVHFFRTKLLWWAIAVVGLMIFVVQLMFIFGAMGKGSVRNISASHWDSDPQRFFMGFSYASYLLSALDAVRTCVDNQGTDIVPRALIHVMTWSVVAAFASIIAQAAYNYVDATLDNEAFAYNSGLRMILSTDDKLVTLFSLPGALGSSLGFFYCTARQVRSMASSGLLPPFLAMGQSERVKDSSQPVAQATSVVPRDVDGEGNNMNNCEEVNDLVHGPKPTMAVFACSVLCFSLLLAGFCLINNYYKIFSRTGELLNALIFHFNPDDNEGQGLALFVFTVGILCYYFLVVQKRQFFSKEEQEQFMKAYVVNANKTRKRGRSNGKQSSGKASTILSRIYSNVLGNSVNNLSYDRNHSQSKGSVSEGNRSANQSRGGLSAIIGRNAVVPNQFVPQDPQ